MNNKNQKKRRWYLSGCAGLCLIIIGTIFGIEHGKTSPDFGALWQNIALSVLCSIVASTIFLSIQKGIDEDHSSEMGAKLDNIDKTLSTQQSLYSSGIKSIREKEYYDGKDGFWKEIMQLAEKRLDLTGHSLSNWFKSEYKQVFCDKIKQMLEGENTVRIVLSSSDYAEYTSMDWSSITKKKKNQLRKIEKTCLELKNILENVTDEKRKKLEVYVTDKKDMTYMYIRTDNQCFISPYLFASKSSGGTFLLELETEGKYSKCFENDFEEIIEKLEPIKLL